MSPAEATARGVYWLRFKDKSGRWTIEQISRYTGVPEADVPLVASVGMMYVMADRMRLENRKDKTCN